MSNSFHKVRSANSYRTKYFPLLIIIALIGFSGCMHRPAISKEQKLHLNLPLFANATFEPLLDLTLTTIFKRTLYEQGWQVNETSDQKAKILEGRITGFGRQPISLDQKGAVREYRIHITLKVVFLEAEGGERFSKSLKGVAEYIARSDSGEDRLAKDRAIREAGRRMAKQVANLLQNDINIAKKMGEEGEH